MKTFSIIFACIAIIIPSVSMAAPVEQKNPLFPYRSHVSSFAQVTEAMPTIGVFGVTFTLTATGEEVHVPTKTEREGDMIDLAGESTSYTFLNGNDEVLTNGTSIALLLSSAERQGDYYTINKGETAQFTLLALLDVPPTKNQNEHYRMRMTGITYDLPYRSNGMSYETNGLDDWKTKEIHIAN